MVITAFEDDRRLLEAWKSGDLHAADRLLDRHFETLKRFFENKAPDALQDLVQNTLLECVKSLPSFREEASFRTFMFAVARNVLKRHYAGRRSQPTDFSVTSAADLAPSPSAIVGGARERRTLLAALRSIPLDYQIILELRYWEELSSSEIGDVLDRPAATIRTQLVRAKELVAEQIRVSAETPAIADSTWHGFETWIASLRSRDSAEPVEGR